MMPAIYIHGMATLAIYYPTYSWAFIQVFMASMFITFAANIHQPFLDDAHADPWEDDWDHDGDEYAEHDGYDDEGWDPDADSPEHDDFAQAPDDEEGEDREAV